MKEVPISNQKPKAISNDRAQPGIVIREGEDHRMREKFPDQSGKGKEKWTTIESSKDDEEWEEVMRGNKWKLLSSNDVLVIYGECSKGRSKFHDVDLLEDKGGNKGEFEDGNSQALINPNRIWEEYSSTEVMEEIQDWGDEDFCMEAEPMLMLPPYYQSDWVIKKVVEVKRRLGYSFQEMKHHVEEFFWEIEQKCSWSLRKDKDSKPKDPKGRRERELKKLHSEVNYEGKNKGRERMRGHRGFNHSKSYDDDTNFFLEY